LYDLVLSIVKVKAADEIVRVTVEMRSERLMWWTLLWVSLSFPPLLDKMVDDEANKGALPHENLPFSASSMYFPTTCSCLFSQTLTWLVFSGVEEAHGVE
jgi:hypothetical protein